MNAGGQLHSLGDKIVGLAQQGAANATLVRQQLRRAKRRRDLRKVDNVQRLVHVQRTGLTVIAYPTPVVDAVGGVGVLLNFGNEQPTHDGVHRPGRDADVVACLHRNSM